MKKLILILIVLVCSQILFAQSENAENKENSISQNPQYSESKSYRPERIYPTKFSPDKKSKKKKDKTKKKDKIKTVEKTKISSDDIREEKTRVEDKELIMIPVSVFDEKGKFITDLKKVELKIFENEIEQEISFFGIPDISYNIFLLIDKSPSFVSYEKEINRSVETFIKLLKSEDKIMVAYFGDKLNTEVDLTDDKEKVLKAVKKEKTEEGTAIYEVIETLNKKYLQANSGQNIVIFVSDGVDTTSKGENYESALRTAEKSNAVFYPITIDTSEQYKNGKVTVDPRLNRTKNSVANDILGSILAGTNLGKIISGGFGLSEEEYKIGKQFLTELAASTGGRNVAVKPASDELKTAFELIGVTIRLQQFIGYRSNNSENNIRKEIKVRVNRPNLIVRIRDNYYQ